MGYSLNSIKGVIWGSIIGVIKGDTRVLRQWLIWGCSKGPCKGETIGYTVH